MSAIGFESTFYARIDQFSRSLDHVIIALKAEPSIATDEDWLHTSELLRTLAANKLRHWPHRLLPPLWHCDSRLTQAIGRRSSWPWKSGNSVRTCSRNWIHSPGSWTRNEPQP
jgi:hypothetical protein